MKNGKKKWMIAGIVVAAIVVLVVCNWQYWPPRMSGYMEVDIWNETDTDMEDALLVIRNASASFLHQRIVLNLPTIKAHDRIIVEVNPENVSYETPHTYSHVRVAYAGQEESVLHEVYPYPHAGGSGRVRIIQTENGIKIDTEDFTGYLFRKEFPWGYYKKYSAMYVFDDVRENQYRMLEK